MALPGFVLFYLKEVVLSNLRVAHDVVTPRHRMRPAFLCIDTSDLNDREKLALTNLVSMTPGTLSLDLINEDKELFVHAMYVEDEEALTRELNEDFKGRIRDVF